jgi:hypothetical protein
LLCVLFIKEVPLRTTIQREDEVVPQPVSEPVAEPVAEPVLEGGRR